MTSAAIPAPASLSSADAKKTVCGVCRRAHRTWYDRTVRRVRDLPCGDLRIYLDVEVRRVDCRRCGGVKRERLDWHAVKEMDQLYMREQLAQAGEPRPAVIGIDEISVRKGHVYRIVVSDLERGQPIWFGGVDQSEVSMTMFYDFLGAPRTARIRLAVMDMWKPFRKAEYKRLTNRPDRTYIKGQKYVLLSHRANLSPDKRRRLQTLLAANKRLNTAYVLKEQFGQLWECRSAACMNRLKIGPCVTG